MSAAGHRLWDGWGRRERASPGDRAIGPDRPVEFASSRSTRSRRSGGRRPRRDDHDRCCAAATGGDRRADRVPGRHPVRGSLMWLGHRARRPRRSHRRHHDHQHRHPPRQRLGVPDATGGTAGRPRWVEHRPDPVLPTPGLPRRCSSISEEPASAGRTSTAPRWMPFWSTFSARRVRSARSSSLPRMSVARPGSAMTQCSRRPIPPPSPTM